MFGTEAGRGLIDRDGPGQVQRIGHPLRDANELCLLCLECALSECLPQGLADPSSAGPLRFRAPHYACSAQVLTWARQIGKSPYFSVFAQATVPTLPRQG